MNASPQILLIDDDRNWLETLADCLRRRGFAVRTADRPRLALALLDRHDVRAVVSDFRMPEMDGLELLRQIHRRRRHLPVLLLSSEDDPQLAGRALTEGAWAFLSKSTAPRVLVEELRHILTAAVIESALEWALTFPADRQLPPPTARPA
jgi:two-component system C4-dicarboxylate transport response regulator DctD